jgi:serine protease Do
MSRRFTLITIGLTATVAFLIGLIIAGSLVPAPAVSEPARSPAAGSVRPAVDRRAAAVVSFADIAERINPTVVNIEATSRGIGAGASRRQPFNRDLFEEPFNLPTPPNVPPRRGSGSGFVIERDGLILTNQHVIDGAQRISIKFSDGRSMPGRVVGADPDVDIALVKVDGADDFPVAPLGDSSALRVGEWVCAIGNPLAYEHTVTVGVVSYLGRKLFDSSLDNYIQTDAAITLGNSGGPLINSDGRVVGVNSAISSRASSIGFAVPINQATAILPQLKEHGYVLRGYIGVALTDVDPDLQASLNLSGSRGALVQDVTDGSPGQRAGLRPYDLIVSLEGRAVASDDELIREVARRSPGTIVRLQIVRDNVQREILIRLGERPGRQAAEPAAELAWPAPDPSGRSGSATPLGLSVRELDRASNRRSPMPRDVAGVVVSRVEPMSAASDAGIERGYVVMEINRQPVTSVDDYRRITRAARSGDVLALYVYIPDSDQRVLRTVRIDTP